MLKSTGIVRKIDDLGRVVLPVELRRTLHIEDHDPFEIYVDGERIVLRKYQPACVSCGRADDVAASRGRTFAGRAGP